MPKATPVSKQRKGAKPKPKPKSKSVVIEALTRAAYTRTVSMWDHKLTPSEVTQIADALRTTTVDLHELVLAHTDLGDGGIAQIFAALRDNRKLTNLTKLDFGHNGIGQDGMHAIAAALHDAPHLRNATHLNLDGLCEPEEYDPDDPDADDDSAFDELCFAISSLSKLCCLSMGGGVGYGRSDKVARMIAASPALAKLSTLCLTKCEIDDDSAYTLILLLGKSRWPLALSVLDLTDCVISDKGFVTLDRTLKQSRRLVGCTIVR